MVRFVDHLFQRNQHEQVNQATYFVQPLLPSPPRLDQDLARADPKHAEHFQMEQAVKDPS